jgi:hypothetical protein
MVRGEGKAVEEMREMLWAMTAGVRHGEEAGVERGGRR